MKRETGSVKKLGLAHRSPPAPEAVKEFMGQQESPSVLDRPPFSKGGLEGGESCWSGNPPVVPPCLRGDSF